MEMKKDTKKTIGLTIETYDKIKSYCKKNGLKITWLTETVLLNYINEEIFPYADYVVGFSLVNITFEITGITDALMQEEVKKNLYYYFQSIKGGVSVSKRQYENVIFRTRYKDISLTNVNFIVNCKKNNAIIQDINIFPNEYINISNILFL